MEHNDYKALLVAANLARYKGGEFMIMLDKWKLFCTPCHPHPCLVLFVARQPRHHRHHPSCRRHRRHRPCRRQSPATLAIGCCCLPSNLVVVTIALAANAIARFVARQPHPPLS